MEVLERREEIDRIENHEAVIVPKEQWEEVATNLAKELELGTKEGMRLRDFLILLSRHYGIEPEGVMQLPEIERAEKMENLSRFLRKAAAKIEEWLK